MTKIRILGIPGEQGELNGGWRQGWGDSVRNTVRGTMGTGKG